MLPKHVYGCSYAYNSKLIKAIIPVVLCGGSGTRLWPVSRKSFPKQFVPLVNGKSLLELTLCRLGMLTQEIWCVASEDHRFLVAEALGAAGVAGPLILEPVGKNTAAAMALAALRAKSLGQMDSLLLFCPADHHIPDAKAFAETIEMGIPAAQSGAFVTFGVVPTFPSTAYGYIEKGTELAGGICAVSRFIEKPDEQKAEALILNGNALWNAGIFLVRADTLLNALSEYADDVLEVCANAMKAQTQEKTCHGHVFIRPESNHF